MRLIHALTLALALTLMLCAPLVAQAGDFNLKALEAQASQAVPSKAKLTNSEADGRSAFVAFQMDDKSWQFTLSSDMDPQVMDREAFSYKGHDAIFFSPGMPGGAGVMVILAPGETSLTLLYSAGFMADEDPTRKDLTAMLDKMDLKALQ